MIRKLRIRFVTYAMIVVLALLIAVVVFSGYRSNVRLNESVDKVLNEIQDAYAKMDPKPGTIHSTKTESSTGSSEESGTESSTGLNSDVDSQSEANEVEDSQNQVQLSKKNIDARYFVVSLGEKTGNSVDLTAIKSVTKDEAYQYAKEALDSKEDEGYLNGYFYRVVRKQGTIRVIFLSKSSSVEVLKNTIHSNIIVASVCSVGMLFILIIFSRWAVNPIVRSYEKQKQFITAASHELKTPLTVINADAEILEMDDADNEWIQDIRMQVSKMTELTYSLIDLSRMDEDNRKLKCIEFPISDVIEESAKTFQSVAVQQKKQYSLNIQAGVTYKGDENAIRQLVSILLDNAFKYSEEGGTVQVKFATKGTKKVLTITNSTTTLSKRQLNQIFDRFYRSNQVVDAKIQGFGLGLSIADSVVKAHKGKIVASMPAKNLYRITVIL